MINILAAAATTTTTTENPYGFWEALAQGGVIAWSVFSILVFMSVVSFYILFTKLFEQQRVMSETKEVRSSFWKNTSLKDGRTKLKEGSAYRQIVDDGMLAMDQHNTLEDPVEAHEWLNSSLGRSQATINSKLGSGLSFLATVGATAPFIGLFGTVIGIYRALIAIGSSGQASIDKVAGPVGEALIMTALGLAVAVPAVLAYNWLQRRNKAIAEDLGLVLERRARLSGVGRQGDAGAGVGHDDHTHYHDDDEARDRCGGEASDGHDRHDDHDGGHDDHGYGDSAGHHHGFDHRWSDRRHPHPQVRDGGGRDLRSGPPHPSPGRVPVTTTTRISFPCP